MYLSDNEIDRSGAEAEERTMELVFHFLVEGDFHRVLDLTTL
jgi:hypothetical protein